MAREVKTKLSCGTLCNVGSADHDRRPQGISNHTKSTLRGGHCAELLRLGMVLQKAIFDDFSRRTQIDTKVYAFAASKRRPKYISQGVMGDSSHAVS